MRFLKRPLMAAARRPLAVFLAAAFFILGAAPSWAADSAVILLYHRFGEDRYPSTNIRMEQFEAHIKELASGDYTVLPVPEILAAFKAGRELPERTVGITIDDAYESVFENGWPRFKDAGLPVTLFVSTGPVDEGRGGYMTWDQIRQMADEGATIGNHSVHHPHMIGRSTDANRQEIAAAQDRFKAELGHAPALFAFPYGEFGAAEAALVERMGFEAAFAQYSSVAFSNEHFYSLPRFALNESYGNIDRFRLVANALPIPARDFVPSDPVIETNPPAFGFTLVRETPEISRMSCFPSHMSEPAKVKILGGKRVEVRFDKPFPEGRNRINCTMRDPNGRWHWLGQPFFVTE